MRHPQIAARVFHTPLLAAPAKAAAFITGFGPRITGGEIELHGAEPSAASQQRARASLLDDRLEDDIRAGRRMPYRAIDGIAVIPVTGTLVHRGSWIGQSSGETSYEGLAAQIESAASDPYVRGVALEVDSFGGEVAGCFSLADQIRELRSKKPVWAFVADHAFSAGYAIASQADRVIVPRTGGVGSIGVICMHADLSARVEAEGVKVTVIAAGDHKADANPYEPLPDSVRADLAQEMEQLRDVFAATVGEGRGAKLDRDGALATEASTYLGADAVAAGLADEVANPREAFERFVAHVNGRRSAADVTATKEGSAPMSTTTQTAPQGGAQTPAPDATQPPQGSGQSPAPGGDQSQGQASAQTQPAPRGQGGSTPQGQSQPNGGAPAPATPSASEERTRIAGILGHPEAAGRDGLAKSLAFESDMSVEQAAKHLAAAPKTATQPQGLGASIDAEATEIDAPPAAGGEGPSMAERAKARWGNS
ncbi:signal peptide peptidase SppA [Tranquillimonas rosea]|uniref:Signal peptide peptidase SppA n=1 Tax=Tranquillimonas rosea TaxID=641238 RepID=A0A1H9PP56_9RHOB|nr:S49 family peptidase [Tranquillimonas rosea]SER49958.1 signal peptide peptidase SppA [Tranquillimonas rosea]